MSDETAGGSGVACSALLGEATGWAWARHEDAEEWCGGFLTRAEAVGDLLDSEEDGGWVCQTKPVTGDEDDGEVQEGWTFLCILETAEFVEPEDETPNAN